MSKESKFLKAVRNNNFDAVKKLVEEGVNINTVKTTLKESSLERYYPIQRTALHLAANRGFNEIVQYLIDKGAAFDVSYPNIGTPMCEALLNNHYNVVCTLYKAGANILTKIPSVQYFNDGGYHVETKIDSEEVVENPLILKLIALAKIADKEKKLTDKVYAVLTSNASAKTETEKDLAIQFKTIKTAIGKSSEPQAIADFIQQTFISLAEKNSFVTAQMQQRYDFVMQYLLKVTPSKSFAADKKPATLFNQKSSVENLKTHSTPLLPLNAVADFTNWLQQTHLTGETFNIDQSTDNQLTITYNSAQAKQITHTTDADYYNQLFGFFSLSELSTENLADQLRLQDIKEQLEKVIKSCGSKITIDVEKSKLQLSGDEKLLNEIASLLTNYTSTYQIQPTA